MTLYQIVEKLKEIAMKHPNIRTVGEGNIYDALNANPSIKYDVFYITQGTHTQDESFDHYHLTLFYISRLENDLDKNRLQIQSIGKEILRNVVKTFVTENDVEIDTISYTTFTQKFADECAGCYADVVFDIPLDYICEENY